MNLGRGELGVISMAGGDYAEGEEIVLNNGGDSIAISLDDARWLAFVALPTVIASWPRTAAEVPSGQSATVAEPPIAGQMTVDEVLVADG